MSSSASLPIAALRIGKFRTLRDVEFRASGQITVLCGPNNSGKSSLLDALEGYSYVQRSIAGEGTTKDDGATVALAHEIVEGGLQVGLDVTVPQFLDMLGQGVNDNQRNLLPGLPEALLEELGDNEVWWVPIERHKQTNSFVGAQSQAKALGDLVQLWTNARKSPQTHWAAALISLTSSRNITQAWFERAFAEVLPTVDLRRISDVRRASDSPLTDTQLGTLVRAAAFTTEVPPRKRTPWARELEGVLQDVFGADVRYQATPAPGEDEGNELRLAIDGQTEVHIDHVGAGVREVVAVAFAALSHGGPTVLCIEEPENCLHPTAARRLIKSLAKRTNVQLIVSTHSAAVVNSDPHTIISLERSGTTTTSRVVTDARSHFRAVSSLGHSPADLVLAHCALWVEGPSDRLYLNAWLRRHGLEEGLDYSVMFYGGALGANVGISSDPKDQELYAEVRPLCRRTAIVADSDQTKPGDRRKPHVLRWVEEASDDPDALVLTTPYREIENCAPLEAINTCLANRKLPPITEAKYKHAKVISDARKTPKVRFAEEVLSVDDQPGAHAADMVASLAAFVKDSRVD